MNNNIKRIALSIIVIGMAVSTASCQRLLTQFRQGGDPTETLFNNYRNHEQEILRNNALCASYYSAAIEHREEKLKKNYTLKQEIASNEASLQRLNSMIQSLETRKTISTAPQPQQAAPEPQAPAAQAKPTTAPEKEKAKSKPATSETKKAGNKQDSKTKAPKPSSKPKITKPEPELFIV